MNRTFRQRQDWFDLVVLPAIRRRNFIGLLIIVICVVVWGFLGYWVSLLCAALVAVERAFEIIHIPKTKRLVNSLTVSVNENGIAMRGDGLTTPFNYPWKSISYQIANQQGPSRAIWVEDRAQRLSKIKLEGYEGMDDLIALIVKYARMATGCS